jgi:hypothetical protein
VGLCQYSSVWRWWWMSKSRVRLRAQNGTFVLRGGERGALRDWESANQRMPRRLGGSNQHTTQNRRDTADSSKLKSLLSRCKAQVRVRVQAIYAVHLQRNHERLTLNRSFEPQIAAVLGIFSLVLHSTSDLQLHVAEQAETTSIFIASCMGCSGLPMAFRAS